MVLYTDLKNIYLSLLSEFLYITSLSVDIQAVYYIIIVEGKPMAL